MRVAQNEADLSKNFSLCVQEAQAAFGDGSIYLEKYLSATHHVEVQIAVDHEGTALHFGERDCSLQRRHQKLVEESPSTALSRHQRYLMTVAINGVQSSSTAFSGNPRQSSEPRDDCEMMTVPSAAAAR